MPRVTITLDDALMAELDTIIAARGYQNRSEAIRDLARAGMREAAEDVGQKRECVGSSPSALPPPITSTTSCRLLRCTCISIMTPASK